MFMYFHFPFPYPNIKVFIKKFNTFFIKYVTLPILLRYIVERIEKYLIYLYKEVENKNSFYLLSKIPYFFNYLIHKHLLYKDTNTILKNISACSNQGANHF